MIPLDVVTVVSGPALGLRLTVASVLKALSSRNDMRWLVVKGPLSNDALEILKEAQAILGTKMVIVDENGPGIYAAMNQSLRLISKQYFIFINSGDVLLDSLMAVEGLNESKVHCFISRWHNAQGRSLGLLRDSSKRLMVFGVMPNHQGMIFPISFTKYRYDEQLSIGADKDLKLFLWREGMLETHNLAVSSSLRGGVSGISLHLGQVLPRYREQRVILHRHFPALWAEALSTAHLLQFLRRTRLGKSES